MTSNAAGQLLGYSLQFPRALYHLLQSGPNETVCVEVLGDVARSKSDGTFIAEEDKSSITGNPLTDRSVDLWKTFSNWIDAINGNELDVSKTKFILYCNQSGRHGIVNEFASAKTKEAAKKAVIAAKNQLKDITNTHEIWPFYNQVMNLYPSLLEDIIVKFEVQIGSGTGYEEVREEIRKKIISEPQVEFILQNLSGWLQNEIMEKIYSNTKAIIKWEEFSHQFMVIFQRARRFELIDFTLQNPPHEIDIKKHAQLRPCYLRQLEAIKSPDDEVFDAVSDFIRAKVNRDKWIENETIDEDVASDFETKLSRYWENRKKAIEIMHKNVSEEDRGMLLYLDCKARQEKIKDMDPPYSTISGTYHALADEPIIGWHPNWEKSFLKPKDH